MSTSDKSLQVRCRHHYPDGFTLDVDLEANGEITALVGPSGSGKTTLLAIIAGLLRPDSGLVRLGSRALTDTASGIHLPPDRRRIGLVPQDHCLFPHLDVRRNLVYGLRRRPGTAFDLDSIVETLELTELLDRKPRTLSGGQKQRVALGRSVLSGPELLLLDEPVTGLDAALRDRIMGHIVRVVASCRIPTILVSHDQEVIRNVATRVVTISRGRARSPASKPALSDSL